ncbi:hypothetical protein [Streptomyces cyaneofuscatus]|uniref:hypothetical protein n=1 Tax=Streptomyces cyaneofuscatus TaxID=66883 RepID=UPI0036A10A75
MDSWPLGSALRLISFRAEEGEGEIDAFDLTDPALGFRAVATIEQVGFQLREAGQHLRIDVQHWTADAGVFVLTGSAVRASAGAELDLAPVEVVLELVPLLCGGIPVLVRRPDLPTLLQVGLVVADHVLVPTTVLLEARRAGPGNTLVDAGLRH